MKRFKFHVFIFLLAGAVLYAACRKTDREAYSSPPENKESRFFADHASADPLVQSINHFVKTQNETYHFVDKMIDKIGYPIWDKVITVSGNTAASVVGDTVQLTFIPFVRDSQNRVNATLAVATTPTDTSFRIVCDWQYRDPAATGMSEKNMALTMMQLDEAVFGNRLFTITDSTLFDNKTKFVKLKEGTSNKVPITGPASLVTYIYSYTICWTEYRDKYQGQLHGCYPGQLNCNEYNEIEQCITVSWELGGGTGTGGGTGGTGGTGGGTGGGGGSGTGGGWVPPDPDCGEASFSGGGTKNNVTGNCEPGWVPGGGSPSANQTIIDSLQGYPCAQGILAQLPGLNNTAKTILQNVFGVDSLVNIVFVADSTLPQNVNAQTQVSTMQYNPSSGYFKIRVRMNPWVLKNSSKEFIIKTMFHESIHAYINYQWKKYENGLLDSTSFKLMFPKIWGYKKTPYTNLAQHTEIAHSYVGHIMSIVKSYNSQIADSTNKGISWSGLYETQAWKNLGSDTIQLNRLRTAARNGTMAEMTALKLKKCN